MIEERLFQHLLATGTASGHKIYAPIAPRGITCFASIPVHCSLFMSGGIVFGMVLQDLKCFGLSQEDAHVQKKWKW